MKTRIFAVIAIAFSIPAHAQLQQQAAPSGHHGGRSGSVTVIPTAGLKAEAIQIGGHKGWKIKVPGGRALATPAVVGDTVFVGGGFGSHEFYAFDAQSGAPRWAIRVSDDGPTAAVVADDKVVFNTESCTLFVVDARTGKQLWSRWLGDPLMSQPAIAAGVIYMAYPGAGGHHLIALGLKDGKTVFDTKIAGDIISAPVVDGDSVYLTTFDGTVYRHRTSDGKVLWSKKMSGTSAPWIAAGEVHVSEGKNVAGPAPGVVSKLEGYHKMTLDGRDEGGVMALKAAPQLEAHTQARSTYMSQQKADDSSVGFGGGAPSTAKAGEAAGNVGQSTVRGLWEYQGSRPTVVSGLNYTAQGDSLRCIDTKTGKVIWDDKLAGDQKKLGGHLSSPPAWAAGKLVVGTATGAVESYEAKSGKKLWSLQVGEEIRFQPALVRGRVFVGTARGTLLAIDSGDATLDGWTMWGGGPRHNGPETGTGSAHASR